MFELSSTPLILEQIANHEGSELQLQKQLRREFADDLVRAALQLHQLRQKARTKFSRSEQMWFDRKGLEQATSELVARHKAQRFHGEVLDLCCGIGGDAIALAEHNSVRAVDINPACCLRTAWNAEVYGAGDNIEVSECDVHKTATKGLVHIDPDQRANVDASELSGSNRKTRHVRVEHCEPNLDYLLKLCREVPGGAIKLSPASNFGGKFLDCEVELVSLNGECKEATIWWGELAGKEPFRATSLPSGETLAGNPMDALAEIVDIHDYLFDPDPAIVRAGLVDQLAESTGLFRLDAEEEYLTGSTRVNSPFVRSFRVLDRLPNNARAIRAAVRRAELGQIEIKCRHIPIHAQTIRRKLTLNGQRAGVLVFARISGKATALLCERV